ncbi:hypothetical protein F383_24770 [Gossypium arboreum]|uniref:Uncharacterized protein n=1 Tax=Gossypium arboreum TaxID=29729 RepID=A0A0B0M655_GOSAR|nr:hypothetical protein F383_36669 [Gossypium arboreum]KHG19642.1 hypothetical protein F383_24770 [Gossypium arboreum]
MHNQSNTINATNSFNQHLIRSIHHMLVIVKIHETSINTMLIIIPNSYIMYNISNIYKP